MATSVEVDPSWERVVVQLSQATAAVDRRSAALRRATAKVTTPKEAVRAKDKLRGSVEGAAVDSANVRKQLTVLEGFLRLHPARRTVGLGLGDGAQRSLSAFAEAQMVLVRKIGDIEQRHARAELAKRRDLDDDDDDDEGAGLVSKRGSERQQQDGTFDVEVYDAIMQERSKDLAQIATDIQDIHEIFQHIRELVDEQGEQLDVVDHNMEQAAVRVHGGRVELEGARRQQLKNTTSQAKMCAFFFLLLIGVLLIVTVAYK
jgi:hypothetical protein